MDDSDEAALPLVHVLAAVLNRLVVANTGTSTRTTLTKFSAAKQPAISIIDYLERIHKYARCSTSCFVLALVYIDRLIQRDNFVLSHLNVHRVVITSIMVAAKFFDDLYFNNAFYARVGGIPTRELNDLEVDFLLRVNFSLRVAPAEFEHYNNELLAHIEKPPGIMTAGPVLTLDYKGDHPENLAPSPRQQQQENPIMPPQPPPRTSESCSKETTDLSAAGPGKSNDAHDVGLVVCSGPEDSGTSNKQKQTSLQESNGESWPMWSSLRPVRQQS